MVIARAGTE